MIPTKLAFIFCFLVFTSIPEPGTLNNNSGAKQAATDWLLSSMPLTKNESDSILGNPQIVDGKYGKALRFNGETDGIFLNRMPLAGLDQFTIELIFCPESDGNFEQRFFHCGEIRGDRVLLELRATETDWYLDAFIKSGDQNATLIEPKFLHPLDQWYHLAYVVDHGKLTTYINGTKELEGQIVLTPLQAGKTSLGVRQNQQSWFKGSIYKIRITPAALHVNDFIKQ